MKLDIEDQKESISDNGHHFVGFVHMGEEQVAEDVRAIIEDANFDETIRITNLAKFLESMGLQEAFRDLLCEHRDIGKVISHSKRVIRRIKLKGVSQSGSTLIRKRLPVETQIEKDTVEKLVTEMGTGNVFTLKKDSSIPCTSDFRDSNSQKVIDSYNI